MQKKLFAITIASISINTIYAAPTSQANSCPTPVAELKTNMGIIDIQLNKAKAPISVNNFIDYVNSGFYNNKIFHRVIPGFMIQGGGFDANMKEAATKSPIKNEASNGLKNDKYTVAMARTMDPDSATAQFFINVKANDFLNYSGANPGYAVFGKVIKGFDTVDKIAGTPTTTSGMYENVPKTPIIIQSAKMLPCTK